jgi:uracil-DNA glycosylase
MRVDKCISCKHFPCKDINKECYIVPEVNIKQENIRIVMVSEAAPQNKSDYFYSKGNPLLAKTTTQAFRDAGAKVSSIDDVIGLGVYLTTAVKCGKTGYGISTETVKECSQILEEELLLFPDVKVLMLMGDIAIKAINYIAKRAGEQRVISNGPTYKIRGQKYFFKGRRVFPSYLQAGPSFFIEKSKRKMISEDIAAALSFLD